MSGSVARVKVRGQAVDKISVDDRIADGIFAGFAEMELLWAQKYTREDSKPTPSPNWGTAAYILCYCYEEKGHYARDCTELTTAKCNFCRKNRHLKKVCKSKKDREEAGGRSRGEASFFLGGVAEEAECNMASLVQFGEVCASFASTFQPIPSDSSVRAD